MAKQNSVEKALLRRPLSLQHMKETVEVQSLTKTSFEIPFEVWHLANHPVESTQNPRVGSILHHGSRPSRLMASSGTFGRKKSPGGGPPPPVQPCPGGSEQRLKFEKQYEYPELWKIMVSVFKWFGIYRKTCSKCLEVEIGEYLIHE